MSNLILVIGKTGGGKSYFTQKMLAGKNCFVFDVNNEYDLPENYNLARSRDTELDMDNFISIAKEKKNTMVVIEDATGYFKGNLGKMIVQTIQQKRHSGNQYILLFHAIAAVPKQIRYFVNQIVLFKTNDVEADIKATFPRLIPVWKKLAATPNLKGDNGKEYSPKVIINC